MHSKANVNVYLLLVDGDSCLLSLRQNTGYEDGQWSLVSGHKEIGEAVKQAMAREAAEEIGIVLNESHLDIVHFMYRKSDRENIDIFMRCSQWSGVIDNKEPHKCGGLHFYRYKELPTNTISCIRQVIKMVDLGVIYSECGLE